MEHRLRSIRPFVGAKDFDLSGRFYRELGFEERVLSDQLSLLISGPIGFYLQDAFVKDWIDNTMVFLEVDDADRYWTELVALDLEVKFPGCRLVPVRRYDWGKECFLHDPSGVLWHFGSFVHT